LPAIAGVGGQEHHPVEGRIVKANVDGAIKLLVPVEKRRHLEILTLSGFGSTP